MALKKNLLASLQSLVGADGAAYTPPDGPQAGLGIKQWGYNEALKQRQGATRKFWDSRAAGDPLSGFLPPSHATPLPNQWETMGHVMKGRANAINANGMDAELDNYAAPGGNAPSTRFDTEQIGIDTGHTLGEDTGAYQNSLNKVARPSAGIINNLRRKFGI